MQFQFCPVAISTTAPSASTGLTSPATTSSAASLTSVDLPTDFAIATAPSVSNALLLRRQGSTSAMTSTQIASNSSASPTSTTVPVQTSTTSSGTILYHIGQYQCSQTLDIAWLIQLVQGYVQATSNTLKANVLFFEFNLHAAASGNNVAASASQPSAFPVPSQLVGTQFQSTMGSDMYTPSLLNQERSNLNSSWYQVANNYIPAEFYMKVQPAGKDITTSTGWPNLAYILLQSTKRIMLSWGTIDPQMHGYNTSGDTTVFPSDTFAAVTNVQSDSNGNITSGCFADLNDINPLQTNSSWATSEPKDEFSEGTSTSFQSLVQLNHNFTRCGISPQINQTLFNATADSMPIPYRNISRASIWTWAPGEPTNQSSADDSNASLYRCAFVDITTSYNGRWRVDHCNQHYRAACRVAEQPYLWTLTPNTVEFSAAASACPTNSSFEVPRTGLEATYLLRHLSTYPDSTLDPSSPRGDSRSGVWVNFNSLDVRACWTVAGANASCPYTINKENVHQRTVLVPVVAAIVILALSAITLFVKCNANRRTSRRRKRGEGGWDYEGVPS